MGVHNWHEFFAGVVAAVLGRWIYELLKSWVKSWNSTRTNKKQ